MYKIVEHPRTEPDDSKAAWNNLVKFSKRFNFKFTYASAIAWLYAGDKRTLQDLEKELRKHDVDLFLIARKPPKDTTMKLALPNKSRRKLMYTCEWDCRLEEICRKDMLEYSKSIKENCRKLLNSGYLIEEDTTFKEMYKKAETSTDLYDRLMLNKVEIDIVTVDPIKVLRTELQEAKERFGQMPEPELIGMGKRNEILMGFFIKKDDQETLVSKWGMCVKNIDLDEEYDEDFDIDPLKAEETLKNNVKIIDLTDSATWGVI